MIREHNIREWHVRLLKEYGGGLIETLEGSWQGAYSTAWAAQMCHKISGRNKASIGSVTVDTGKYESPLNNVCLANMTCESNM